MLIWISSLEAESPVGASDLSEFDLPLPGGRFSDDQHARAHWCLLPPYKGASALKPEKDKESLWRLGQYLEPPLTQHCPRTSLEILPVSLLKGVKQVTGQGEVNLAQNVNRMSVVYMVMTLETKGTSVCVGGGNPVKSHCKSSHLKHLVICDSFMV